MSKKNNLATRRRQHEFDLQSNMTATIPCPLSLSLSMDFWLVRGTSSLD
jgi:hypothetical protein